MPSPKHKRNRTAAYLDNKLHLEKSKAVPCFDCGNSFPPVCMDFDLRDGEAKLFTISSNCHRARPVLVAEISKCDIVCACCHRLRTQKRGWIGTGSPVTEV